MGQSQRGTEHGKDSFNRHRSLGIAPTSSDQNNIVKHSSVNYAEVETGCSLGMGKELDLVILPSSRTCYCE